MEQSNPAEVPRSHTSYFTMLIKSKIQRSAAPMDKFFENIPWESITALVDDNSLKCLLKDMVAEHIELDHQLTMDEASRSTSSTASTPSADDGPPHEDTSFEHFLAFADPEDIVFSHDLTKERKEQVLEHSESPSPLTSQESAADPIYELTNVNSSEVLYPVNLKTLTASKVLLSAPRCLLRNHLRALTAAVVRRADKFAALLRPEPEPPP